MALLLGHTVGASPTQAQLWGNRGDRASRLQAKERPYPTQLAQSELKVDGRLGGFLEEATCALTQALDLEDESTSGCHFWGCRVSQGLLGVKFGQ